MEYRDILALNWSSLKHMASSAKLYRWRIDHPRPDTPALDLGTAVHCAVLEPDTFDDRYIVRPKGIDLRKKAGKEWKASIDPDKPLLSYDQGWAVEHIRRAVAEHPIAAEILEGTRREETVTWTIDGVACKGRVDAIAPDRLVDLKTTSKGLARFERDTASMLYHCQLAWYADGCDDANLLPVDAPVYIIAAETVEPYDVGVYCLPPEVLEVGRATYERLLGYWCECTRADRWPGQCPGLQNLELPAWAQHSEDEGF